MKQRTHREALAERSAPTLARSACSLTRTTRFARRPALALDASRGARRTTTDPNHSRGARTLHAIVYTPSKGEASRPPHRAPEWGEARLSRKEGDAYAAWRRCSAAREDQSQERRETARRERGRTDDAGELVDLALGAAEGSELCVETAQNESARPQGEGKHARLSARRRPPCLVLLDLVGPTSRPAPPRRQPHSHLLRLPEHAQPHSESRGADVRASWSACEPSCPASARGWVSSPSPQLDTGSEGTHLGVADQLHDATLVRGEAGNLSHEERVSSSRGTAQESERDDAPRGRST